MPMQGQNMILGSTKQEIEWISFYIPDDHLHFLFEKGLFSSAHFLIRLFVYLMYNCVSPLHMLDINP